MFWVMMYMLFFGGTAAQDILIPDEAAFQQAIQDYQRLENVLVIHQEVKNEEQLLADLYKYRFDDLTKLSPQYEADINEFRDVFSELDSARIEAQSFWLNKRFQLKEQMTSKEWEKAFSSK